MKNLISFILSVIITFLLHSCFKANNNVGHDGRCTGSAYCTACTNCSRCGHCSGGGTCGVCSGGSSAKRTFSGTSYKKNKSSSKGSGSGPVIFKSNASKRNTPTKAPPVFIDEININTGNRYMAGVVPTNIYEKPSFHSKVIEKVQKNTKLIRLSKKDVWYKVKIEKSGKTGYVYYKDVK